MSASKVWSRFKCTKEDGGILALRIQDSPIDRYQEILEFLKVYYICEEALECAAGVNKSDEAISERITVTREIMSKPTVFPVFCCLDDDSEKPQILGISIIELTKSETAYNQYKEIKKTLQSKELIKFAEILDGLSTYERVFLEKLRFEEYYACFGISVHADYRRLGIAAEFMKQRRQMCIETGVPMTMAWMTTLGTQKAANKEGWEMAAEVSFGELGEQYGVVFETNASLCKLMFCRV